jgi:hypothetical protein
MRELEPGRAVHGSREPSRPGAHDHEIADAISIDLLIESETVRNLRIRRTSHDPVTTADHNRDVADANLKPIEPFLRAAVAIEIEVLKWMAIPRQELLHAERPGAMAGTNHDDIAQIARDQRQPTQDERPHQNLAQLRVGLDQGQQLVAIEVNHLARLADAQTSDRAPPLNQRAFA